MGDTTIDSAKLLVKLQGQGSRTVELTGNSFTIGRKADNDLTIDDHTVSSHHARIIRVQSVYFVEDLRSTNGTTLNGRLIERTQLHDTDVIAIGQHRIVFQDNTPVQSMAPAVPPTDLEQTMAIRSKDLQAGSSSMPAKVVVTSGKTDRLEYHLTKPANLIGSQEGAVIQLTGWFAPQAAALISHRGGIYSISPSQGGKKLLVNGKQVSGQQQLNNSDVIEVAGVSMIFYTIPPKCS